MKSYVLFHSSETPRPEVRAHRSHSAIDLYITPEGAPVGVGAEITVFRPDASAMRAWLLALAHEATRVADEIKQACAQAEAGAAEAEPPL